MDFVNITSHFWSLCVEVQFYVGIAILFLLLRRRGLMLIPFFCLAFTLYRVMNDVHAAINTYYRIDEILVGSILGLIYNKRLGTLPSIFLGWVNPYIVMLLLLMSCHPDSGFMNYFRPYFAAMLVGSTLFNNETQVAKLLGISVLFYIAEISYALYIIHPILADSWLGSGTKLVEYAKRPLLFAVLFLLAHTSTFYFEHRMISVGKKLSDWYKLKLMPIRAE
jgi:peptidoglycan/LPS O-acetylase OafA/YrhL